MKALIVWDIRVSPTQEVASPCAPRGWVAVSVLLATVIMLNGKRL